jgi:ABC-2 type transport system permease protein
VVSAAPSEQVYDSAVRVSPLIGTVRGLWAYSGLIRLLVVRDLTVRYKRSVLGVWWTVLNPLLTASVLWVVFSQVFRFEIPGGVPFIVYLLSGLLVVTFYGQGLIVTGNSMVGSTNILTKVYVPPEVFALSAAAAQAVNFSLALVPLLLIQLVLGVGVPWTVLLLPFPVLALLALVTGTGLLVATVAVRFQDVMDLVAVFVTLLIYATPTFYPPSIVPERFRLLLELNPLFWYVDVFRNLLYGGTLPPWQSVLVVVVTASVALPLGVTVFARRWRTLAVML